MYANVSGCRVYYERAGAGRPLLFLHGWGSSSQSFKPLFLRAAANRTAIAPDFPGFGLSAPPPHAWGTKEYAEMTKLFLDQIGVASTDVLAHSFGARVALVLAREHPEKVGGLALTGAAGIRLKKSVPFYKRALSKIGKAAGVFGPPGVWIKNKIYSKIASADYLSAGAMRPVLVKVVNEDLSPILPEISHKTLLLWGADDSDTTLAAGRAMNSGLKNSSLSVIDGAGHYAFLDKPDEFYSAIKDFLGLK
ncbi:MAG: alpha/beta hydrolase [Nitrospinae bacterium]|nr:alpha/beta hydrolase [Nitrospinota bacterium]